MLMVVLFTQHLLVLFKRRIIHLNIGVFILSTSYTIPASAVSLMQATSKDAAREVYRQVHYEGGDVFSATTGSSLVVRYFNGNKTSLPPKTLLQFSKTKLPPKSNGTAINLTKLPDSLTMYANECNATLYGGDAKFPAWVTSLPSAFEEPVTVSFDVRLLQKVVDAMGASPVTAPVTFTFNAKNAASPVIITPAHESTSGDMSAAYIMPWVPLQTDQKKQNPIEVLRSIVEKMQTPGATGLEGV